MTSISLPAAVSRHADTSRARLAAFGYATLRVGAGLLFMQHGMQKLFGLFGGFGAPGATAPLVSQMGLAGGLELIGGALLVLGLFTRPVAVLVLGEMLYAFLTVHAPQGGAPVQNGGELALLYAVVFVFLTANGAGSFSLDAVRARASLARSQGAHHDHN